MRNLFASLFFIFLTVSPCLGEPIKIGAMLCLTGSCAPDGQAALNGINLALKELGNSKFELVAQDTSEATSSGTAVTAYRSLRDKGIKIFIGPTWSNAGQVLGPIVAREKDVVAMTPSCGSPLYHMSGPNIFNLRGIDEQAMRRTAQIARKLGVSRIAIFGSQQTWSVEQTNSFSDEFLKLGGTIVSKVEPLPGETDLKSFTLKLLASKPEAIFISVFAESPIAVRELAAKHFQGKKFAAAVHPFLLDQAREEFEGTIYNTFQTPGGEFSERYFKEYKEKPLVAAGTAYDAIQVLNAAIESIQDKSFSLRDRIHRTTLKGAFGELRFDENRCVIREPAALVVEKGEIVPFTFEKLK